MATSRSVVTEIVSWLRGATVAGLPPVEVDEHARGALADAIERFWLPPRPKGPRVTRRQFVARFYNETFLADKRKRFEEGFGQSYDPEVLRPVDPSELSLDGGWECPQSPTKSCAYDMASDEGDDACIFCGKPEERK